MRIILVEDHLMFREVIRRVCATDLGHTIAGETRSARDAVTFIVELGPDLVILDLQLSDGNGFEVIHRVQQAAPSVHLLVLTSYCDPHTLFRLEGAKIHGFLDKTTDMVATLREALNAIAIGRTYFSATFRAAQAARNHDPASLYKVLSGWEIKILSLIGRGLSDDEIGAQLDISPRTAQTHRSNILLKLGIGGTPKLIAYAMENGVTRWR